MTIPGRIISITGETAVVDYGREKRECRMLDESFKIGDYVIVANKIILDKIGEEEAIEAIEAWNQAMNKEDAL